MTPVMDQGNTGDIEGRGGARPLLERFLRSAPGGALVAAIERAESRRPNLLRILTYHRVLDPEGFDEQMLHLSEHYDVVGLDDLLAVFTQGRVLGPRSIMITFDDADRDVGEIAWPVLKRYGLPASVFVPTGYPDRPDRVFWWEHLEQALECTPRRDAIAGPGGTLPLRRAADRRRAASLLKRTLKALPLDEAVARAEAIGGELAAPPAESRVLGWEALRRLAREGLTVASHSRTHPFMDRVSLEEARAEIAGARDDLLREIGPAPPAFAFPDGRFCAEVLQVLREEGFVCAFTTRRGTNDLSTADPLRLRRINMSPRARAPLLRARLVHSSAYLNRWRRFFDPQRRLARNGEPSRP